MLDSLVLVGRVHRLERLKIREQTISSSDQAETCAIHDSIPNGNPISGCRLFSTPKRLGVAYKTVDLGVFGGAGVVQALARKTDNSDQNSH
jgi:hypothetical protein